MSATERASGRDRDDSHSCHRAVIAANIPLAEQSYSLLLREQRHLGLLPVSMQAVVTWNQP